MSDFTKTSQTILKKAGYYTSAIDGDFGKNSQIAARKYYDFPSDWNADKLAVGVIQVYATRNNIKVGIIDGFWGNNTQSGYLEVMNLLDIKAPKPIEVDQNIIIKPTYNNWPKQDYDSMVKFYGKVGENQTSLVLPYEMKLAWDLNTKVSKITCHEKMTLLRELLNQRLREYLDTALSVVCRPFHLTKSRKRITALLDHVLPEKKFPSRSNSLHKKERKRVYSEIDTDVENLREHISNIMSTLLFNYDDPANAVVPETMPCDGNSYVMVISKFVFIRISKLLAY